MSAAIALPALEDEKRCAQCWKVRPLSEFIGKRGQIVTWCCGCKVRYRNWSKKTPEEKRRARPPVIRTGTGYTVRLTMISKNIKTGLIPVSSTDMASCPPVCPHMDQGCYAGYGKGAMHWKNVARDGVPWREFCAEIAGLPTGQIWRHNEAGDLPGLGNALDMAALRQLVRANTRARARGFTFTHKPLLDPDERRAIAQANRQGFTINLSADSPERADELADLKIGPVALVLPSDAPRRPTRTPAGRTIIVCLHDTHGLTCDQCGLCTRADRHSIVGFPAHGQAAALVTLRVRPPITLA